MKQEQALIQLKEQARFYISTPERAAEALLFVRELERFAEEIKAKVKERTIEIMDRESKDLITYSITDQSTGEMREWEVRRSYGTILKEYRPKKVVQAIGMEKALEFMKVSKSNLERYLKRASSKGEISMQQVETAVSEPIETHRKGAGVIMREIKPSA